MPGYRLEKVDEITIGAPISNIVCDTQARALLLSVYKHKNADDAGLVHYNIDSQNITYHNCLFMPLYSTRQINGQFMAGMFMSFERNSVKLIGLSSDNVSEIADVEMGDGIPNCSNEISGRVLVCNAIQKTIKIYQF